MHLRSYLWRDLDCSSGDWSSTKFIVHKQIVWRPNSVCRHLISLPRWHHCWRASRMVPLHTHLVRVRLFVSLKCLKKATSPWSFSPKSKKDSPRKPDFQCLLDHSDVLDAYSGWGILFSSAFCTKSYDVFSWFIQPFNKPHNLSCSVLLMNSL